MLKISEKTQHLKQSGIRNASTRCNEIGGINLGQGVCDIPIVKSIKQSACDAINNDKSLYSPCEGILELRQAVAKKLKSYNKISADPATEVVITHGSTGAFICAIMTLFNPGDEVILFEPFYGYHKNILNLHNIQVKSVPMSLDDLTFDPEDVRKAITPKTKGIVICTPCNPSGKVFTQQELQTLGEIAEKHDLAVITDEIYEYITYPGYTHVSPASLPIFKPRTITISGFSKTYNMTGWRLGYATGPQHIISKMALVQDLVYVCPNTPLQHAVLAAFDLPDSYFEEMKKTYHVKRDSVVNTLIELGFKPTVPQGAYYIMADFSKLKFKDDEQAAQSLLENSKVATVPGRSFFIDAKRGEKYIRVCYALNEQKINLAMQQLKVALA